MSGTLERPLYCSFCGKRDDEVSTLVAGPTVFICDECIEVCAYIVGERRGIPDHELDQRVDAIFKTPRPMLASDIGLEESPIAPERGAPPVYPAL